MKNRFNFKKWYFFLILIVIIWRLSLFLISWQAPGLIDYQPSFPYADVILIKYSLPAWIYSWANFDGVHYITIVESGYKGIGLIQAFFPVLPMLLWLFTKIGVNIIYSAIVINLLALIGLVFTLFILFKNQFGQNIAWGAIIALLLFPTSFYFGAVYTEALFLLFLVQAFYWSSKNNWRLTSLFIILASSTRVIGVLLVPALMIEVLWRSNDSTIPQSLVITLNKIKKSVFEQFKPLLWIAFGSLGLLSYMFYLWYVFGDPLLFYNVQADFGTGRQETIVLLPQVFWRYLKMILTVENSFLLFSIWQELLMTLFAISAVIWSWSKIPLSWSLFGVGAIILPTLTGTLTSMPRYIIVCLSIWYLLGYLYKNYPKVYSFWIVTSATLLIVNLMLFIQGYWVA